VLRIKLEVVLTFVCTWYMRACDIPRHNQTDQSGWRLWILTSCDNAIVYVVLPLIVTRPQPIRSLRT
jgi:hypothetical protein